jgi:hypothetical protein
MHSWRAVVSKTAYAAILGAGVLFAATGAASAYVVCNDEGDCWHTHHRFHHSGVNFTFYNDDWYFHHRWGHDWDREHDYDYDNDRHYRWHDYHEGHGYWRNGVWVEF